jgi:exodeoxyribonuclease V alpha subunit
MRFQAATAGEQAFDDEVRVRHVLYEAPDGDFAVVLAEAPDGVSLTAAGPLGRLPAGGRARVAGRWVDHPRYGLQVQVDTAYELDPDDVEGALRYLTTISRIGKRRARQLVDAHGPAVLERIDADPEAAFAALPRMGARAAGAAAASWHDRRALRDLYVLLAPHGAGWLARSLQDRHGAEALQVVRAQPYRLTEESGVGFPTADAIARAQGIPPDAPERRRAAVVHVLAQAERRGHTYLPTDRLRAGVQPLVGPVDAELIEQLAALGAVVVDAERVALPATWEAEAALAARMRALAAAHRAESPRWLARATEDLSDEQRHAVEASFARRLSVVTGGPGTGKTTLVRTLARLATRAERSLALCAPTGRAARRLTEATGQPAATVHRLLEWAPDEGPLRDSGYPLEQDLLVVDESSMLSLQVAQMLFDAVGDDTTVVLVGDADQLPPVGAGKPFADLIDSGSVPVTRLTHVFRQSARSMIVGAAHAVRGGAAPPVAPGPDQEHDFFVLARERDRDAADTVVELATGRLARHYGVDPVREVQVLAPVYRGPLGIDALNERLRAELNPHGEELLDGDFRRGDKLIQTRNDYDVGLMNGQVAIAVGADDEEGRLIVESDDGRTLAVPAGSARWLRLAYAISVHRAQGCEVPVVVVPVHATHGGMLSRNLLYTAITRAQRACVLVGQPEAAARAARRADAFDRHTRLSELLAPT